VNFVKIDEEKKPHVDLDQNTSNIHESKKELDDKIRLDRTI
jgi:hypothetical protein